MDDGCTDRCVVYTLAIELTGQPAYPVPLRLLLAGCGHFCWIRASAPGGLAFPAPGHAVCALLQVQVR